MSWVYACALFSKQIFSCPSFIYKSVLKATDKFVTIKNMRSNIKFIRFPLNFTNPFIIYLEKEKKINQSDRISYDMK